MIRCFIVLCIIACTVNVQAQSIRVNARLDTTAISLGDQVKLHIEVERPQGTTVQFPAWNEKFIQAIEIVEVHPVDSTKPNQEITRYMQDLTITSFDSGYHTIPPLRFIYRTGSTIDTIASNPLQLAVYNMPVDSIKNIFDIKPVYKVPIGWADIWPWLLAILAVVVVLLLVALTIYLIVRYKNNKPVFVKTKVIETPHVVALRDLDNLRTEKLWQNNHIKVYYTRLSDIIRTYIEGRFGVAAMELTREEILAGLKKANFEDNNLIERLDKLFARADLVKFAKAHPLPDENETSLLDAYLFVNNTKPVSAGEVAVDQGKSTEGDGYNIEIDQLKNKI